MAMLHSPSAYVWLSYLALMLSPVWGCGLPLALWLRSNLRSQKLKHVSSTKAIRDIRGATIINAIALLANLLVILVVLYKMVCTHLL
jgi:hypothetical protein